MTEGEHRECIQIALSVVLDRLDRDLAHIGSVADAVTLDFGEMCDALSVLSETSEKVHALTHQLDDNMLRWAKEKHIAAALLESVQ